MSLVSLEPTVEFHHRQETTGHYETESQDSALTITDAHDIGWSRSALPTPEKQMGGANLSAKSGKFKYKGAERTFSTRFSYAFDNTAPMPNQS